MCPPGPTLERGPEQQRRDREQRFLAEVGPILASSLDYEETLAKIAELAVQDITPVRLKAVTITAGSALVWFS